MELRLGDPVAVAVGDMGELVDIAAVLPEQS
jgi:hypothetical protein